MPGSRLEALKRILAQNPADTFARYGLAMEHLKAQDYEQAVAEFEELVRRQPDHAYACFHAGQALEKLGRPEDARRMYRQGIEAADRKGDAHARSELQSELDRLG
ncbi:MAG: tetratricopeptide repeat protein [Bryobacterales bacterium]|nr:tetratricopeptide repeat protein [Bryobacterales bacterium]